MLKDIRIGKNKITLTCSLPQDLDTFKTANATPANPPDKFFLEPVEGIARTPLTIDYISPRQAKNNCRIELTLPEGTTLYYEDMEKLAGMLKQKSPETKVALADDALLEKFRLRARKTFPSLRTELTPTKAEPKAEFTADGMFEMRMNTNHPNYTNAKGEEVIGELVRIYGFSRSMVNGGYFTAATKSGDKALMEKTADVLASHGIIAEGTQGEFVQRTRKDLVRSSAIKEFSAIRDYADLAQPYTDAATGKTGLSPYMQYFRNANADFVTIVGALAQRGDVNDVPTAQLHKMQQLGHMEDEGAFGGNEAYKMLKGMTNDHDRQQMLAALCRDYLPEIEAAIKNKPVEPVLQAPSDSMLDRVTQLVSDCGPYTGMISATLEGVNKRNIHHFRNRDLVILQKTEAALTDLQKVAGIENQQERLAGALGHLTAEMNTMEGADAVTALLLSKFPGLAEYEVSKPNYRHQNPERFKSLWNIQYRGATAPIKPEEYAQDVRVPECRDVTSYIQRRELF